MNGEAKHTPGPWVVHWNGHYPVIRKDFHNHHHMVVSGAVHGYMYDPDEKANQEANAHLIAAAPDLLQACELVAKALEADKSGDVLWACDGNTAWEVLTEAIAKAKGGEA